MCETKGVIATVSVVILLAAAYIWHEYFSEDKTAAAIGRLERQRAAVQSADKKAETRALHLKTQEKTTTQRFSRPGASLLKAFAVSIPLALSAVFAASSPGFAAEAAAEIWEKDGNVALAPQAAKDLLMGIRELRAENEALTCSLESERAAALEVIAAVQELREQIRQERRISQETISMLQKQLKAEKRKTKTVGIISLAAIAALAL